MGETCPALRALGLRDGLGSGPSPDLSAGPGRTDVAGSPRAEPRSASHLGPQHLTRPEWMPERSADRTGDHGSPARHRLWCEAGSGRAAGRGPAGRPGGSRLREEQAWFGWEGARV